MKPVNVAVVGATGAVGEVMIEILESRGFPVDTLYPLASSRSAGKSVQFRGKHHTVQDLSTFDFSQTPIGLLRPSRAIGRGASSPIRIAQPLACWWR